MALLEMSIVPLGVGESVSAHVARCVDLVDRSGLPYELHAMGTIVEGDLSALVKLLEACIEEVAKSADRVNCSAKIDYRKQVSGGIQAKVASVEAKLGRPARRP